MILKEVSVDRFCPENEREGSNVHNWSLRLNVSGYQFDINELNVEYWILNIEFWILNLNIEYWIWVLNLSIEFEYWFWMFNLNIEYEI